VEPTGRIALRTTTAWACKLLELLVSRVGIEPTTYWLRAICCPFALN